MVLLRVLVLLCSWAAGAGGQYGNPLNKYIRHYEGLSYDVDSLHQKHQRAKRAVSHEDQFLRLDFHAHGRHFNLRLKKEMSLFSDDFKLEMSDKVFDYDTSHIYTGHIYGEQGSFSHGSVVDGRFEGFVKTHTGTFYIEPAERYVKDKALPFHSVMYHEDDISQGTIEEEQISSKEPCTQQYTQLKEMEEPYPQLNYKLVPGKTVEPIEQINSRKTLAPKPQTDFQTPIDYAISQETTEKQSINIEEDIIQPHTQFIENLETPAVLKTTGIDRHKLLKTVITWIIN